MLNDATCFKSLYIVCGYTDLRAGMDRPAALAEAQTGNRPYVPDTIYLFCGRGQTASKALYGKGTDGSYYIRRFPKAGSNGPAVRGSTFIDAAAVPLADGRADDHPEEISQASRSAGIYGVILC